ncbi:DUF2325 domain-containing protein [Roseateles aquatilis]|nr:DUF2325 domain-containing protein [Roseateles aquatilis]
MLTPPFKRSPSGLSPIGCCDHDAEEPAVGATAAARTRLHQLDGHLHCSVIGTCLGTAELRRLMTRHASVKGSSDLEVHHLAVSLAAQGGEVSKALHKALDQRHAGAVRTFAAARDAAGLDQAWKHAWSQGDIPGAYWALLTHKAVTPELRQAAFGEVHMLSHLMGSANRHELKRFVTLERDNADLHDRLEREQSRRQEAIQERDQLAERLRQQGIDFEGRLAEARARPTENAPTADAAELIALHTQRREHAERIAEDAGHRLRQVQEQLDRALAHAQSLTEELSAAEGELQQISAQGTSAGETGPDGSDVALLAARRVLYVGGRPSSTPAIRDFVHRHGGEFLHHDGGLESRKGLLSALLPRADLVVFPVDCVDHDSVANLKRLAERHQVPFVPLRSASLASFAATLRRELTPSSSTAPPRFCLRHG